MELMDIVNAQDEVIGTAPRSEIYEKLLVHRIVHVLIFNSAGKMLLQQRADTLSFCPSHWSTAVGGHVQSGESYEQAALREYEEELGATSKLKFFAKDFYDAPPGPQKFLGTFISESEGPFHCNPKEVSRADFFALAEIHDMILRGEKFHPELLFLIKNITPHNART